MTQLLSIKDSQKIANEYLEKIDITHISLKRKSQCSNLEIFYTMLIRALMTKESNILIVSPLSIIENIKDIETIIQNINLLNDNKNIIILDTITNETHYKGCSCHIIK
ncbi:MAG: hypothetical protein U9P72_02685 [Campylobacterota bacterium]|nr:hypothetical protein [Campylobacterota bacterium]